MPRVKLSRIVQLYTFSRPVIEKAALGVAWDETDQEKLGKIARQIKFWGSQDDFAIERDVPLGLGDTDALIRLFLSVYQLYAPEDKTVKLEQFEKVCLLINEDVYWEVADEILDQLPRNDDDEDDDEFDDEEFEEDEGLSPGTDKLIDAIFGKKKK